MKSVSCGVWGLHKLEVVSFPRLLVYLSCLQAWALSGATQTFLKASNPDNGDGFGSAVAAAGDILAVSAIGESSNAIGINGTQTNNSSVLSGAAYVFKRANGSWVQEAYLKPLNTGVTDRFGAAMAMSGDTLVVGAPFEDSYPDPNNSDPVNNDANTDSGAAYVFVRNNGVWTQQAMLKGGHELLGWNRTRAFGASVAIDGDTIVVGSPRDRESLVGINPARDAETVGPYSVGAAYVYRRQGTQWTEVAYIKPPYASTDADLQFGSAVAVAGKNIFVSTIRDASSSQGINGPMVQVAGAVSGAVCAYRLDAGVVTLDAFIKASNAEPGDGFGWSIAAHADALAVSAIQEDSDASGVNGSQGNSTTKAGSGAVYVFNRNANGWTQTAYIKSPAPAPNENFGLTVALKGDALAVTSNSQIVGDEGSSKYIGAVFLYARTQSGWGYVRHYKPGKTGSGSGGDSFGLAMALSGNTVIVGASADDNGGVGVDSSTTTQRLNSGAAYVYSNVLPNVIVPVSLQMPPATPAVFTLDFSATPGLATHHFVGGTNVNALHQDLSLQTSVTELTPGNYRASITLPPPVPASFFLRLNP